VELLRRERWTGVRIAQITGLKPSYRQPHPGGAQALNKAKMLEPQASILR
jgi:hypothetical protein